MTENVLFSSLSVVVTPSVVRCGSTSYQVANIGSVAVHTARRVHRFALFLIIAGIIGLGVAYWLYREQLEFSSVVAVTGAICLLCGIIWQSNWPVIEYTLVLKTSSSETEVLQ